MNQFFTWDMLLTFAGAVAGTAIVTEFLKKTPGIMRIPVQFISYFVALLIMVAAKLATGTLTPQAIGLDVINAVVVSFASNGAFDAIAGITEKITDRKMEKDESIK